MQWDEENLLPLLGFVQQLLSEMPGDRYGLTRLRASAIDSARYEFDIAWQDIAAALGVSESEAVQMRKDDPRFGPGVHRVDFRTGSVEIAT
jgi:hypothetical protein